MMAYLFSVLGFLLSYLLFSMGSESNRKANYLLATLLFLVASFCLALAYKNNYLAGETILVALLMLTPLMHGPILYHYIKERLGIRRPFKIGNAAHFIPFLSASIYLLIFVPITTNQRHLWWSQVEFSNNTSLLFASVMASLTFFSYFSYAVVALRLIYVVCYREKKQHSNQQIANVHWLKTLCYAQLLLVTFAALFLLITNLQLLPSFDLAQFVVVSSAIWFFIIIFYGFRQPEIFQFTVNNKQALSASSLPAPSAMEMVEESRESSLSQSSAVPLRQSLMMDAEAKHYFKILVEQVESSSLYLDAELKIATLSECLGLTIPQISYVINHCAGKNFYEFINTYRINYAKDIAQTSISRGERISPAEMADRSGYNTKATFYKHFKIYTGKTPRAYISDLKIEKFSYVSGAS